VVDQSLHAAERLRQSILRRAFEGRLVEQDATDPPASSLLEQIAERLLETIKRRNSRRRRKQEAREGREPGRRGRFPNIFWPTLPYFS